MDFTDKIKLVFVLLREYFCLHDYQPLPGEEGEICTVCGKRKVV